jgi:hypothetical protein
LPLKGLKYLSNCFYQLHFETVCKSMMSITVSENVLRTIIKLSLGDSIWRAYPSKEAHVNRHSSRESEL